MIGTVSLMIPGWLLSSRQRKSGPYLNPLSMHTIPGLTLCARCGRWLSGYIPHLPPLWILEPSCGAGAFLVPSPPSLSDSHLVGVELDKTTAKITQALYPEVDIKYSGLEQANLPSNQFDVIIGNVPFGNYGVTDPSIKFNFLKSSIHDYFIAKSITLLKPNGHAILITSRYTLDKKDSSTREWLCKAC